MTPVSMTTVAVRWCRWRHHLPRPHTISSDPVVGSFVNVTMVCVDTSPATTATVAVRCGAADRLTSADRPGWWVIAEVGSGPLDLLDGGCHRSARSFAFLGGRSNISSTSSYEPPTTEHTASILGALALVLTDRTADAIGRPPGLATW